MQVFLRAQDYELWKIVYKGPVELSEDEDLWTKEQIKKSTLNWSAMNMMRCAVHPKEYSKVSSCKSAKEMWDKLPQIYEGTSEIHAYCEWSRGLGEALVQVEEVLVAHHVEEAPLHPAQRFAVRGLSVSSRFEKSQE
ncbi:hypothetical protein Taro_024518 [Colocasia esculenta]|uniref:Uncharacterized protein n=1 Tax=Colocasia esculenta TaxID=4460 RepID=A0A843VBJ0_COLES|nr:hypothetical protein [Colocasia esculenta]